MAQVRRRMAKDPLNNVMVSEMRFASVGNHMSDKPISDITQGLAMGRGLSYNATLAALLAAQRETSLLDAGGT